MEKLVKSRANGSVDRESDKSAVRTVGSRPGFASDRAWSGAASNLPVSQCGSAGPKLEMRELGVGCAESVFSRIRQSVLVVDADLTVLWSNRMADRFLASDCVLGISSGRLSAPDRRELARVQRWVRKVVLNAEDVRCEMVTSLKDVRTGRFCEIAACPGSMYGWSTRTQDPSVAVLFISDPDQQVSVPPSILETLFGLTESERRLAGGLLNGRSLDTCAADAHVKVSTARTHLKSIFRKTDTKSQAALVALLSRLVPPLDMGDGET